VSFLFMVILLLRDARLGRQDVRLMNCGFLLGSETPATKP